MGGFIKSIAPIATAAAVTGGTGGIGALTPALISAGATLGSALLSRALAPEAPSISFPTAPVPEAPVAPEAMPSIAPEAVIGQEQARLRDLKRRQTGQIRGGGLIDGAPAAVSNKTLLGG